MTRRIVILGVLAIMAGALLVFFAPHPVYAHATGLTLTSTTTDYLVDIDYDTYTIAAGLPGRFTLRLFSDEARTKPVNFSQVWVRITKRGNAKVGDLVFSGWIAKGIFGSTGFSTTIPAVGMYDLNIRYNNGDTELVEATIPFEVVPAIRDDSYFKTDSNFWFGFGFGAILIALLALGYRYHSLVIPRR